MDLRSPSVGKMLRISVEVGTAVERGDELMVIESMKVEIPIKTSVPGRLRESRVKVGEQVERNTVLAVIDT